MKCELQGDYERAYPALRQIIHLVLDEEESRAWELSDFPHLLFPDLVEAHITRLNLRPVETHQHDCPELPEHAGARDASTCIRLSLPAKRNEMPNET